MDANFMDGYRFEQDQHGGYQVLDASGVDDVGDPLCIAYIEPDGQVEIYDYPDSERDAKIREFAAEHTSPEKKESVIPAQAPDMGAVAPAEYLRRDDAAEKRNEVPGRQIPPVPESVVEIRSAVHSNYAGMVAMVGADNAVYLGHSARYDGMGSYDNSDGSLRFISGNTDMYYFLYGEGWAKPQDEMLEHGLTMEQYHDFARLRDGVLREFTQKEGREILFAGQPFQPPENYLKSVEMVVEANYNMVDGMLNNAPPSRADLTDGQTHDEIMELAPETLPENRASVLEQLKAERPEHEARQVKAPEQERGL